jgi:farnesyl-diphosphate farnesyltransferase
VEHAGYLELVGQTAGVLSELDSMPEGMQRLLIEHTVRTAQGMAGVVERADERGNLRLSSLQDLKDYCYIVAGIVGELLTRVFLFDTPSLGEERVDLEARMIAFGEGLQLVNILKDASDDARDGRVYLPPGVSRAEVFALARADLDGANRYVQSLQRGSAPRGYLAFCGISLMLAFASLDRLEQAGPGSKVSREDVARLFGVLQNELDVGSRLDLRVASR